MPFVNETVFDGICTENKRYVPCKKINVKNEMRNETEVIYDLEPFRYCCKGYKEINKKCEPICENACENGFCASPNQCQCNENYFLKNESNG